MTDRRSEVVFSGRPRLVGCGSPEAIVPLLRGPSGHLGARAKRAQSRFERFKAKAEAIWARLRAGEVDR